MQPLISVIVPAYNLAFCISDTLASLTAQTWQTLEIVLVDDASKDDTLRIATEILTNSGRRHQIIALPEQHGVSYARNRGIEAAQGEYLTFLDGDDLLDAGQIEQLYAAIDARPDSAELAISGFRTREAKTGEERMKPLQVPNPANATAERLTNLYLLGKISPALSILYEKKFLQKHEISYAENCCAGEDGEFIAKAMSAAHDIALCKTTGYVYMQHDRMGSRKKNASEKIERYQNHTSAQKRTADFILANCTHESTKKIARAILLPRVCLRTLSVCAMRDDKEKFNSLRKEKGTMATFANVWTSSSNKAELLLKTLWVRCLPQSYFRYYAHRYKRSRS